MILNIDFSELCTAFEQSNINVHYFIDTLNNQILFINEEIEPTASEKIEKMHNDRYIRIPMRTPEDDFGMIELFIYSYQEKDFNLTDRFYRILGMRKPFRIFRELLNEHPEMKEEWFKHKDRTIRNHAINWLIEKGIELKDQQIIPPIEITELENTQSLPEDLKGFGPIACSMCNNKKGFKARFFLINIEPENRLMEEETKKLMKDKFGIGSYGNFTGGAQGFLTAGKCPQCRSEELFWDF